MSRGIGPLFMFAVCAAVTMPLSAQEISEAPDAIVLPAILNLETAQRIAMRDNPSLRAAEERVTQAKFRIKQAQSEWYPSLRAGVSASVTELSDQVLDDARRDIRQGQLSRIGGVVDASMGNLSSINLGTPMTNFTALAAGLVTIGADLRDSLNDLDDTNESYQATLSATWLIFDGFGRKFRNASVRFAAEEIEASYLEAQRLLLAGVATAYYNVQLARENVAIAGADQAFNERQLKESEARRRVGTGSLSDVLNFEIRVRAAQTNVVLANRNHEVALIALAELMGLDQSERAPEFDVAMLPDEADENLEPPSPDGLIVYALAHRPDLVRADFTIDRADAIVKAQRSEFYPSLSAFASQDAFRSRNIEFNSDDFAGTVGVRVDYDIFVGGRRSATVKEAKAFVREAEYLREDVQRFIESDVRQAVANVATSQIELRIQRETTQYVERNLELVEKEYREGQGSLVRLNEAQRDLISQQSRLALARVALGLTWHDLRTATAQTLESFAEPIAASE